MVQKVEKNGNKYNLKDMKIILEFREYILTWAQSPNLRNYESPQAVGSE